MLPRPSSPKHKPLSVAQKARYHRLSVRRHRLRPLLYGAICIELGFLGLMAVYPHLLPLPIAIVLAITGAVLVLILSILYTICFRCPVCGLLLYGKLNPFQEPSQCPFCGADLDDDVS